MFQVLVHRQLEIYNVKLGSLYLEKNIVLDSWVLQFRGSQLVHQSHIDIFAGSLYFFKKIRN